MKFFLTTAIDFVNSRPHLGTAYEKITADIIARYRRLAGYDTYFLMGNDEHSQNVFKKAVEQQKDPLAYCDEMEQVFRDEWKRVDVSFDDFIRTTDRQRHFPAVQKMAQACLDNGDIYEGAYEGWYCESCESFKPEKDLIDGKCPIHLTTPNYIKEKNHFFRLSKYRDPLLRHFREHPEFTQPCPGSARAFSSLSLEGEGFAPWICEGREGPRLPPNLEVVVGWPEQILRREG